MNLTENDIRPAELYDKTQQAYQEDINWLLERENLFIEVSCPVCDCEDVEISFNKKGFNYHSCSSCQTQYLSPRPDEKLMSKFYNNSKGYEFWAKYIFPASEIARKEKIIRPRAKMILELTKKYNISNETIVEVGAGYGSFAEVIKEEGYFKNIVLVEPNEDLAGQCEKKGFNVIQKTIEEVTFDEKVDLILSFEVIEHLFSPEKFINGCRKVLKKGGVVVFSCPNIKGFDNVTLGVESPTIFHGHVNYFHPDSIKILMKKCGFDVVEVSTPGQLDVDIVRKYALKHRNFLKERPFLKQLLIDQWDQVGVEFQEFLVRQNLSGHMWVVGRNL